MKQSAQIPSSKTWADIVPQPSGDLRQTLAQVEAILIRQALEQTDGNVSQAAAQLGLPRQTLQYRLRTLDIAR